MANVLPKGKWSKKWPRCRLCFTTEIPHKAEGLCNRCYGWIYKQMHRFGIVGKIGKKKPSKKKGGRRFD